MRVMDRQRDSSSQQSEGLQHAHSMFWGISAKKELFPQVPRTCVWSCVPWKHQGKQQTVFSQGWSCCSSALPSLPAPCSLCKFKACSRYGLTFTAHMRKQKGSWKMHKGKICLAMENRPAGEEMGCASWRKGLWQSISPHQNQIFISTPS